MLRTCAGTRFALIQAVLPDAVELSAPDFEHQVSRLYTQVWQRVRDLQASAPLRCWNYIPGIHRRDERGLDRYMVFNAGRHRALSRWMGTSDFEGKLVTASAVGTHTRDFVLHVLSGPAAGRPLENPRQVPAYRYSRWYGPRPPCFARALVLPPQAPLQGALLIGGTASVVGEATRHEGQVEAQLTETLRNLASLLAAWREVEEPDPGLLALVRQARVYVPAGADRHYLIQQILRHLTGLDCLEVMTADLCRANLLVEIEGLTASAEPG